MPRFSPTRSSSGFRSEPVDARFAAAQAPRSSHSGDGSVPAGRRPVTSTIRSAARSTRAPNQSGWALMSPAPPASSEREPLGEGRVDHDSASTGTIAASSSRPARVRAATTGEWGTRSSGAPERVVAGRERDVPAALAHDELRGGDVDGAAAPQREHPVDAGVGDLRQRDRDRARSRGCGGRCARGPRCRGAIQRGEADSSATSSRRPSRSRRSGGHVDERVGR